jgi:hypothetical protein
VLLSRLWRKMGKVVFKEVLDNVWLFKFEDNDDKRRVLEGRRPWSFERQSLVLNEFNGSVSPLMMKFMHSPFWV